MDCGVPFCQSGMTIAGMTSGCPLHNLVPEWNDLVYSGNWQQAYNRLHKTNNFPEFTSRVCPALCEKACTCGHWGNPVTVRDNEHGVIETAYKMGYAAPHIPKVHTGKKVAIIGSGPSGLAAADQLNQRGHEVTVYERAFDDLGTAINLFEKFGALYEEQNDAVYTRTSKLAIDVKVQVLSAAMLSLYKGDVSSLGQI